MDTVMVIWILGMILAYTDVVNPIIIFVGYMVIPDMVILDMTIPDMVILDMTKLDMAIPDIIKMTFFHQMTQDMRKDTLLFILMKEIDTHCIK